MVLFGPVHQLSERFNIAAIGSAKKFKFGFILIPHYLEHETISLGFALKSFTAISNYFPVSLESLINYNN